ncbi:MAG: hypothetical protein OEU94_06770 [Aquincola sp.]|nr:hypothetical protein [Aquincola sp.]MDH4287225.1 hypothetical protein [Aquincola sp.]MDH5330263.1 hypothetical protein [Aquincola sp.]
MFAGHIGVALALGRVERGVNVGALVAGALWLDAVLWAFILLGWESVNIPADFGATHQAEFVFPYSHGLAAAVGWTALAAALALSGHARLAQVRWRAASLFAAAVFSHWLLDVLVHRPEMPLLGSGSATVGLGLWDRMVIALVVEAALVVFGLLLFLPGSGLSRGKSIALAGLSLALLAFTAVGMTIAPAPPSASAMAASSLLTLAVVCALFGWLGTAARARQA